MEHRRCIVPDSAPRTFGFAEHVVGIRGRELDPDAEVCAHVASDGSFKHRVGVKFEDVYDRTRLLWRACKCLMVKSIVSRRTCVVFILQEPHPHVVGVVVDAEQTLAEAMWGGGIDWSSHVSGQVEEGAGWFRASGADARCRCGFV
jgi:hypothetical protein